ncbi:Cof-type HAD-IIB family hydrolase [Andreprevotia chitinilytica]|uniref:Cof-type HAD-IIB family hydrolase n=1 Tax=Andreprevotia chitinilytica TaxID=396808 RepID=UPI0005588462|nr:Cof-type HAD-IIB family hydrolase [Andreprevotia chitinilytica]
MIQVIASDLDGTLLDANHTVDAFTAQTLQQLEANGQRFVIATGRHYQDVRGIRDVLGIRAYLITSNGARVHDPDNNPIHAENVEPEFVRALCQPEFSSGTRLNLYLDDDWLIDAEDERLASLHQDSGFMYHVADLTRHSGEGVAKVLYVGDHEHLLLLEDKIRERFGDELYVTFSMPDCLEIMAPTVSKGHALTVVLGELRVPHEDCVAFGDGLNDKELLQTAGQPFLMGNANPKLVAQLPGVPQIGTNDEAAVAHHLRQLLL